MERHIVALEAMEQYPIAKLIEEFSTTIKVTVEKKSYVFWVYDGTKRLWREVLNGNALLNCEFVKILEAIAIRALHQRKITEKAYANIISTGHQGNFWRGVLKFLIIEIDAAFEKELNMNHPFLPLRGGRKINLETLEISRRDEKDYWSWELEPKYLAELDDADNEFAKFIRELFDQPDEYKHFRYILGYLITTKTNQDMFLVVSSEHGGSGKTTLFEILKHAFPPFWSDIHKDIILHGKGNYSAEMCKIAKRRMVIMDEGAPNMNDNKHIDLSNILRLTGGVSGAYRDAYQRGSDVKSQVPSAKLVAITNNICLNSSMRWALNRRIVFAHTKVWFRGENYEPDEEDDDEIDDYLKRSNRDIKAHLIQHIDHAFTFMIKAAHAYLNCDKLELVDDQPSRWKKQWKATENKQQQHYKIFKSFLKDKFDLDEDQEVKFKELCPQLKEYSSLKFNYEGKWIYSRVSELALKYGSKLGVTMQWKPRRLKGIRWKCELDGAQNNMFVDNQQSE